MLGYISSLNKSLNAGKRSLETFENPLKTLLQKSYLVVDKVNSGLTVQHNIYAGEPECSHQGGRESTLRGQKCWISDYSGEGSVAHFSVHIEGAKYSISKSSY